MKRGELMNVFGKEFEYNGICSTEYGAILCSFETVDTQRTTGIAYDLNTGEITPQKPIANFYNKKYKQPIQFKISLCKLSKSDKYFSVGEQRKIVRWITSPTDYRKFRILDDDNTIYHYGIEYFCICTEYEEVVVNNQLAGMTFLFQCNAPYGFYQQETIEFNSSNSSSIIIDNYSDERESIYYPYIEMTGLSNGSVHIHNDLLPDCNMELSIHMNQTLYIDTALCDITDNTGQFKYSTDTNLKWIGLLPGKNTLSITGDVQGKFVCRYPRKVGI